MNTLRTQHEAWMAKWKGDGKNAIPYETPCCHRRIETEAPATGSDQTWDTFTTCPYCNALYFKIVNPTAAKAYVVE